MPLGTKGDNYDRFVCRVQEIEQSMKIVEQALDSVRPAAGRVWSEGESDAVVVTHGFWQTALGGGAAVPGRRIVLTIQRTPSSGSDPGSSGSSASP